MCGSKPKVDTSAQEAQKKAAEEARRKEEERQQRITEGTAQIDETFGQFDDAFYDKFSGQFMDYYQPQLDDQFGDANDQLTFALARSGNLNSTHAADSRAELTSAYDDARAGILSEANAQTDGLRNSVTGEKSSLVAQLNATGDSERASNEATARASQLFNSAPTYNPLGDIFAGITSGYAAAQYGNQQQATWNRYTGGGTRSGGSGRIVGG